MKHDLKFSPNHTSPLAPLSRRQFLQAGALGALGFAAPAGAASGKDPLADHRIQDVAFRSVRVPWPRDVGRNAVRGHHGKGPTVEVCVLKTDQGAQGWGHLQSGVEHARNLRDTVIGKTVSSLVDPARGIQDEQLAPFDIPLHDLAGVILGQPVCRMLGAAEPLPSLVYSGMIYFDDLDPEDEPAGIDRVLENCRWDVAYGYPQLKIKIGRGNKWMPAEQGLQRDVDVVRAVHEAFPDIDILVDGNNGFSVETFIRFMEGIDGIPLFWIEEPFHETVDEWTRLKDWLVANGREDTYRADGEANPDFPVLEALEATRSLTLRLNDICGYGFTRWRRLMPKLAQHRIAASPHTWGSALKSVYTAHLAAALGNTPTVEGVTSVGGDVDFGENKIVDGRLRPSSAPGFGLSLPAA